MTGKRIGWTSLAFERAAAWRYRGVWYRRYEDAPAIGTEQYRIEPFTRLMLVNRQKVGLTVPDWWLEEQDS